jgi:uncharacterized protein (DUF58 family)
MSPRRRRRGSFRINARGWIYLALSASVAFAALFKGNNFLLAVFCALLGLFVVSGLLTVLVARRLQASRLIPPQAFAGEVVDVAVRIHNAKRLWPAFSLRLEDRLIQDARLAEVQPSPVWIPLVGPGGRARGHERVSFPDRGWARLGPFTLTSEFPPGLFTWTAPVPAADRILVFPRRGVLRRRVLNPLLSRIDASDLATAECIRGEQDFAALREYRPGDSPRRIHWKMSARIPGRLLVREHEDPLIRDGTILLETFLPNVADHRRRGRLERAVSFAAALAETLLAEQWRLNFRTFAPEPIDLRLEPRRDSLTDLLHTLATLKATRTRTLRELLDREEESDSERVLFVLRIGDDPLAAPGRSVVVDPHDMKSMMEFDG